MVPPRSSSWRPPRPLSTIRGLARSRARPPASCQPGASPSVYSGRRMGHLIPAVSSPASPRSCLSPRCGCACSAACARVPHRPGGGGGRASLVTRVSSGSGASSGGRLSASSSTRCRRSARSWRGGPQRSRTTSRGLERLAPRSPEIARQNPPRSGDHRRRPTFDHRAAGEHRRARDAGSLGHGPGRARPINRVGVAFNLGSLRLGSLLVAHLQALGGGPRCPEGCGRRRARGGHGHYDVQGDWGTSGPVRWQERVRGPRRAGRPYPGHPRRAGPRGRGHLGVSGRAGAPGAVGLGGGPERPASSASSPPADGQPGHPRAQALLSKWIRTGVALSLAAHRFILRLIVLFAICLLVASQVSWSIRGPGPARLRRSCAGAT
jgi:hypothetical protein